MLGSVLLSIKTQITNSSMNTRNQPLQTASVEISQLQSEVFDLRNSLEGNQSTESRDAENLRNLQEDHNSLGREKIIFGIWLRLNA